MYCQLITELHSEKWKQTQNHLLSTSTSSQAELHCWLFYFPQGVTQEDGEWGLWSVHHMLSLPDFPPHCLPLLQCGVPTLGDSPSQTSSTLVLPLGCSSSRPAPTWILSMGYSPSGMVCSSGVLCKPQFLPENLLLHGHLSSGYSSCQEPAPLWALHRLQIPSWSLYLLLCGVLHGLQGGWLLQHGPPWAAEGQPASP